MFENLFGNIKDRVNEHFEKKKLEREDFERMQREVDFQRKQIFEEQFKKDALEVARAKAKRDAANLSGLQKLRALNRSRNLTQSGSNPGSVFSKFLTYTQKNLANREKNLKRTAEMREEGKKMKEENMLKKHQPGKSFSPSGFEQGRKPFNPSGFERKW